LERCAVTEKTKGPKGERRQLAPVAPVDAKEDWGQLSAELRALPNDAWRVACLELVTGPGGHGRFSRAARRAGFGKGSSPSNLAKLAWKIFHDDRMIAAVASESRKYLRGSHPEAVAAVLNLVRNPKHRDHMRAVDAVLSRADPIESHSRHNIEVLHRTVDPDREALEELRALRHLGTPREKLLALFGHNGLDRIEALEAADTSRRADSAKMIEGKVVEMDAAE
jgi:hypothetical protein